MSSSGVRSKILCLVFLPLGKEVFSTPFHDKTTLTTIRTFLLSSSTHCGSEGLGGSTVDTHCLSGGVRIETQVIGSCLTLGLGLTKLMVVGEPKAIHMALVGDSKSEIGTTESILEPHMAPATPGFQEHTLGHQ